MLDDLRTYLQMASGITEATTAKARDVITGLLTTGASLTAKAMPSTDVVGQVQELADDLVTTSRNNRELLVGLIRSEVDRAVGRMGFVREDELAALRKHVQRLERELAELAACCDPQAEDGCCGGGCACQGPAGAEPAPDVISLGEPGLREGVAAETVMADTVVVEELVVDERVAEGLSAEGLSAEGLSAEGLSAERPNPDGTTVGESAAEPAPAKKKKKILLEGQESADA